MVSAGVWKCWDEGTPVGRGESPTLLQGLQPAGRDRAWAPCSDFSPACQAACHRSRTAACPLQLWASARGTVRSGQGPRGSACLVHGWRRSCSLAVWAWRELLSCLRREQGALAILTLGQFLPSR